MEERSLETEVRTDETAVAEPEAEFAPAEQDCGPDAVEGDVGAASSSAGSAGCEPAAGQGPAPEPPAAAFPNEPGAAPVWTDESGEETAPAPQETSFLPLNPAAAGGIEPAGGQPEQLPAPQDAAGPAGQPALAPQDDPELRAVIEAIVYVTEEPVTARQIAEVVKRPEAEVKAALTALVEASAAPERGIAVREIAGGYKMATKAEHHEILRAFARSLKPALKLSLAALETLATIAYKQPITAPEIMDIRGVQGAGVLKTLLDRKLIQTAGRKNVVGKPILYRTTKEFLIQFGLKDLSELPTLKEFEELSRLAASEPDADAAGEPPAGAANEPDPDTSSGSGAEVAADPEAAVEPAAADNPGAAAASEPQVEAAGAPEPDAAGVSETTTAPEREAEAAPEPAPEVASARGTAPEDSGERGSDEPAES